MSEGGYKAAAGIMAAALLFGMGRCSADNAADKSDSPAARQVKPGPTKTVIKVKTNTVTHESMPTPCKEALRLAKEIDASAGPLINVSTQALDIMADAHQAITTGDGKTLTDLRTKMYQLSGKTSQPTVRLKVDTAPQFAKQMRACINTDAYKAP